jgi:hypothetical protein
VPRIDHETQRKFWQGNFFWSKGCKHEFTPAEQTLKHKVVNRGSSLYPWRSCTCPLSGICPGQRFSLSQLAKRPGGWDRAHNLAGNEAVQESRRNKNPLNCKSPKMATWRILSNLRGWHTLW